MCNKIVNRIKIITKFTGVTLTETIFETFLNSFVDPPPHNVTLPEHSLSLGLHSWRHQSSSLLQRRDNYLHKKLTAISKL